MKGLITDRTLQNVYHRKELSDKGWSGMTLAERAEWLGDPLVATGVNLFPCGPYYSSVVSLKYRSEDLVATTSAGGIYLYAISIVGEASKYENKVFTLSVDHIESSTTGSPMISAYWHDDAGYDFAGASLSTAGSITIDTAQWANVNNRAYLALYVYVTTHETVTAGASARFVGVMLENGAVRHPYVPYTEILPTQATKGAYNYSDLNRVERAVAEISDRKGLSLVTKTDWGMWDIPTVSEMSRYLNNIQQIRDTLGDAEGIPVLPASMNHLTYADANNIEIILELAYKTLVE